VTASLDPETPKETPFLERARKTRGEGKHLTPLTPEEVLKESESFFNLIKQFAFRNQENTGSIPMTGCTQQGTLKSIDGNGEETLYQHTFEQTGK
jgi:hypothetical protein